MSRLLSVWKRLPEIDDEQAQHEWKPKFGRTVEGLTLGVIGLGAIGTAVAQRARVIRHVPSSARGGATRKVRTIPRSTSCAAPAICTRCSVAATRSW